MDEKMNLNEFFNICEMTPQMTENKMKIVGYPSKDYVSKIKLSKAIEVRYENYGVLFSMIPDQDRLNYTMRTGIGFSGSPVIVKDENGQEKIVGIHTHRGMDQRYNSGLLFTPKII